MTLQNKTKIETKKPYYNHVSKFSHQKPHEIKNACQCSWRQASNFSHPVEWALSEMMSKNKMATLLGGTLIFSSTGA